MQVVKLKAIGAEQLAKIKTLASQEHELLDENW